MEPTYTVLAMPELMVTRKDVLEGMTDVNLRSNCLVESVAKNSTPLKKAAARRVPLVLMVGSPV